MKKLLSIGFWEFIARVILRNRIAILAIVVLITVFFAFQWKNIKSLRKPKPILYPADDKVNVDYNNFLNKFGEEGNLIVIATTRPQVIYTQQVFKAWSEMMNNIDSHKEIDLVISVDNLKVLAKSDSLQRFVLKKFSRQIPNAEAILFNANKI